MVDLGQTTLSTFQLGGIGGNSNDAHVTAESFVQEGSVVSVGISSDNIVDAETSVVEGEVVSVGLSSENIVDAQTEILREKYDEWRFGRLLEEVGNLIDEQREWDTLTITVRYRETDDLNFQEEFFSDSEKVSVQEVADGGFRAVDLSNGNNTFLLFAPEDRQDLRPINTWSMDSYDKDLVGRDGNVYDLEMELVPEKEKAWDNEYGTFESPLEQSADSNQWLFDFEFGSIATRRVSAETNESSDGSLNVNELELILTREQVRLVEENISHLNLVTEREVPDGSDVIDDASSDDRNTVFLSPPGDAGQPVPEGNYTFIDWETEWIGGAFVMTWELVSDGN